MTNRDKLLEMLNMQNSLNNYTNGKNWCEGKTKDGKIINWKRCIYMECLEVVDSFSWKHWKNIHQEPNWENVKIEIVDIWHFIMSLLIENQGQKKIENIAKELEKNENFINFCILSQNKKDINQILAQVELIVHLSTSKHNELNNLINNFFKLCQYCNIDIDILYQNYIGKNILNKFRQNNGYKEGKYVKIWNGKEDNEILTEIMQNNNLSISDIYKKLELVYDTLTEI